MDIEAVRQALGPDGPLACAVPGFRPRAQQLAMAEAVAQALQGRETLLVEAGTGTGKTFAYLVPALLSGRQVVISTGTRNLQDQLYVRDLPRVREALGCGGRVALLKGRANYLCLHRLERACAEGSTGEQAERLRQVAEWAGRTVTGDRAGFPGMAEDDPFWTRLTAPAERCLGADCHHFTRCFVFRARRKAQEADVVVVNHHLLMADFSLREEGRGEVLPQADAFVIDEAHQLPDIAARFLGEGLTAGQLRDLARDVRQEQLAEAPDTPGLRTLADTLLAETRRLRLALEAVPERGAWPPGAPAGPVLDAAKRLADSLAAMREGLAAVSGRGPGLDGCARRARRLEHACRRLILGEAEAEAEDGAHAELVRWYERTGQSFTFHATPVETGPMMQSLREGCARPWIYTSATLTVCGRFDHFCARVGVEPGSCRSHIFESPFDFRRNALMYIPEYLPPPRDRTFVPRMLDAIVPVIEAARGRTFILFTSWDALRLARQGLEGRLDFPLLVQGDAPREALLARFRTRGDAVLLGTYSFWEGVDVPGPALSCVIIDKLPFGAPDDPVIQARGRALERRGGNAFRDLLLPQAVVTLRQGVGRLIRGEDDRGVVVVCDSRIETMGYGKIFKESLPDMRWTRRLDDVTSFLAALREADALS